jgi:O-antigen/teichoic acid export membrane protein
MPRFAGISDPAELRRIYLQSTSMFLCFSIVVFVPLAVFFADFLKLWISGRFAQEGALIGFLLAASTIIRGAFLPYEALFRGIGRPQYCLAVTILSSTTVLLADLILIPRLGLLGAGYALCISPVWGIVAVIFTLVRILRLRSWMTPVRTLLLPALLGFGCLVVGLWVRRQLPEHFDWIQLVLGATVTTTLTILVLAAYEFTLCRNEPNFAFARKLFRSPPLLSLFPASVA